MKILVAPTEPKPLCAIGTVSSTPEMYGADVLWVAGGKMVGVQRKTISDLVASVRGDRLVRSLTDMRELDLAILLIEGAPRWTSADKPGKEQLYDGHVGWTLAEHVGVIMGVQARGVWVVGTGSLQETCQLVPVIADWTSRDDHRLLTTRPQPDGDDWGRVTKRQRQEFILQGLPGVGLERARRIIDVVGFPIGLVKEEGELLTVPGVGKGTVAKIREALT